MMTKIAQQGHMLTHYEQENNELKTHLAELRRNFEAMAQMQAKQRENETINQEMYLKKLHTIKTNSTV